MTVLDRDAELARMRTEWLSITTEPDPVPVWETAIDQMRQQVHDLRSNGQWRSGRRTLLGALGVHHDEVVMCRGLAWLLTPDGWHGLGSAVLDGFLAMLDVPKGGSGHATVVVEEPRDDTRADIIVRFEATTVLIEAKIWALEQPRQCDRLAHHWADEEPTLVYLTRAGKVPLTAVESGGAWHAVAWCDIADLIDGAVQQRRDAEPGVVEYLKTLRIYGGTRS